MTQFAWGRDCEALRPTADYDGSRPTWQRVRVFPPGRKGHRPTRLLPNAGNRLAETFRIVSEAFLRRRASGRRAPNLWGTQRARVQKEENPLPRAFITQRKVARPSRVFPLPHGVWRIPIPRDDCTSQESGLPAKRAFKRARLSCSEPFRQCARNSVSAPAPLHTLREVRSRFAVSEIESSEARAQGMQSVPSQALIRRRLARAHAPSNPIQRRPIPDASKGDPASHDSDFPTASARGSGNASPGTLPFARALNLCHLLLACPSHKFFALNVLSITPTRSKRVASTAPYGRARLS